MPTTGMTIDQFGQEIKKKYPQYQNVPDAELGEQVLKKYPQYQRALSAEKPSSVTPAQVAEQTAQQPKNNLLTSLAKPFIKTAAAIPAVAGGVSNLLQGDVKGMRESLTKEYDFGPLGSSRAIGINQETGQAQKTGELFKDVLGTGAEIASFAAPAGVLGKSASLGAKVAKAGLAGAGSGALGAFGSGLQKDQSFGKTVAQTAGGALLGGAIGGAIPGVGAAARNVAEPIAKFANKTGSGMLGLSTGVGSGAFETLASKTPETIGFARQAAREGVETVQNKALEAARSGLKTIKKEASDEYVGRLAEIATDQRTLDDQLQAIRKATLESLRGKGVKFGEGKKLNNLNFERTRLGRYGKDVEGAFNELMNWKDTTPKGLDELKKNLDDWRDVFSSTEKGTPAFKAVDDMFRLVRSTLENNVSGYKEMTSRWSQIADLTSEIEDALSLKKTAKTDTTIRKLASTIKRDNELRKAMLQKVQEASGEDIEAMLSGAALSSWTPRGLQGVASGLLGPTGLTLTVINPGNLPALLVYLASSSPRLLAEGIALARKMTGVKIPETVKQKFMNLLIQATREATSRDGDQNSKPTPQR